MGVHDSLISELEEVISHGTAERRASTLHRVADLFVFGSGHFTDDHIAVFDGVFGHLIAHIELSARAALAGQLAPIANAPPGVIRVLAFDDAIEVAGPVLTQSVRLDNVSLVENAKTKSQKHLLAISRRSSLAETVTDVLVERGDRQVALSAAENPGAKFSEAGFVRLVNRSGDDDQLAQTVGLRPDLPRRQFVRLLTKASQAVRLKLEAANRDSASEIRQKVAEIATAIQVSASVGSRNYVAACARAQSLRASGCLSENDVETSAREGRFEDTVAALALLSDLPPDLVERAVVHDRAETILIIVKAAGLSWRTARAVLSLRAGEGGISKHELDECQTLFMRLRRETAQHVIDFQQRQRTAPTPAL